MPVDCNHFQWSICLVRGAIVRKPILDTPAVEQDWPKACPAQPIGQNPLNTYFERELLLVAIDWDHAHVTVIPAAEVINKRVFLVS